MTLKRIFLNSALVAFFLLAGCSSFTSKTEDYASWFPGDDLLKVNDKDEAWTECFSRDPSDCKEKYIQLDNVSRLKSGVIQIANKSFYCKLSDIKILIFKPQNVHQMVGYMGTNFSLCRIQTKNTINVMLRVLGC